MGKILYFWLVIIMRKLIGRKEELTILSNALDSNRSELIAIYGR
jgi:hypothetical protein